MSCIHPHAQFLPGVWSKLFPFVFPLRCSSVAVLLCLFLCTFFFFFFGHMSKEWDGHLVWDWNVRTQWCLYLNHSPKERLGKPALNGPVWDVCLPVSNPITMQLVLLIVQSFTFFSNNFNVLKALSNLQITFCHQCYLLKSSSAFHLLSSVSLFKVSIKQRWII